MEAINENQVPGKEAVKVTRYILFERTGSCMKVSTTETVYMLLPSKVVDFFRDKCNIDLRDKADRDRLLVGCQVVEESADGEKSEIDFHFTIRKLEGDVV
jgi:hypothetical protein